MSYQIETDEGLVLQRHVDQLRRQYADETSESDTQLPSCIDDEWVGQDGFSSNFPIPVIPSPAVQYLQLIEQLLFGIPPSLVHQLTDIHPHVTLKGGGVWYLNGLLMTLHLLFNLC